MSPCIHGPRMQAALSLAHPGVACTHTHHSAGSLRHSTSWGWWTPVDTVAPDDGADWVVGDTVAPNYFATTLETISADDQLGLIDPRIHLTAVKPDERDGPDLNAIFVKVRCHV